jgi:phosphoserine phosphatase
MTHQDEAAATDRLRQALAAFQTAQNHLLSAERRLKGLPQAEVDTFWNGLGRRLEANMRTTATEVVAAFKQFSAAGFVASAGDRHLVTQAQRHLSAGA